RLGGGVSVDSGLCQPKANSRGSLEENSRGHRVVSGGPSRARLAIDGGDSAGGGQMLTRTIPSSTMLPTIPPSSSNEETKGTIMPTKTPRKKPKKAQRRLTISLDEKVYRGLHSRFGRRLSR